MRSCWYVLLICIYIYFSHMNRTAVVWIVVWCRLISDQWRIWARATSCRGQDYSNETTKARKVFFWHFVAITEQLQMHDYNLLQSDFAIWLIWLLFRYWPSKNWIILESRSWITILLHHIWHNISNMMNTSICRIPVSANILGVDGSGETKTLNLW